MNRNYVLSIVIFVFILVATVVVVLFAKGYRFGLDTGKLELSGTGLLVTKSIPDGAQVFLNDHLTTATDNTINLSPKTYRVKIFKDGYFPWEKDIEIRAEVVSKAEALLFPKAPKLESITDIGVLTPVIDPSETRIAFIVASQSARKNGVYIFDMSSRPILTLQSATTQLTDDTADLFSRASLTWSPDGKQLIATISGALDSPISYLLETSGFNPNPRNVTEILASVDATWKQQKVSKEKAQINSLSSKLRPIVRNSFLIMAWSPDDTKILYKASASAEIPLIIKPRLIGANSTKEVRSIEEGKVYVYDVKEDRNYALDESYFNEGYAWLSDSSHLIFVKDRQISAIEYDGSNKTTIYAGPFINGFVFPWPDLSRIVVLTDLGNSQIVPNLYTISIK